MDIDTMEMSEQEQKQLEIELEGYLDGASRFNSNDVRDFAQLYAPVNFEIASSFYSGFKAALYTMQRYPELLKEKKDEAQE
jgi:hypothetical protein